MKISSRLPETCGIAFKEWEGVCEALATGRQTFILRKGGIEEGPGGFTPEHPAFWLYPTHVHQAEQGLKPSVSAERHVERSLDTVKIRSIALVESIEQIDRLESLLALDELHVWTEETIVKRFEYRRPGLWLLGVRIFNVPDSYSLAITPEQMGCKTWVSLDGPLLTQGAPPALSDDLFSESLTLVRSLLNLHPSR